MNPRATKAAARGPAAPALACIVVIACGSRSELFAGALDAGAALDAGSAPQEGAAASVDSGTLDPCPSAVSGPNAMSGNCSTRDGRSRVRAPATAPHVTWKTQLPVDEAGYIGPGGLSTDSAGHVYVVNTDELPYPPVAAIRRIDANTGRIDWTVPIQPDEATGQAVLLAAGEIELFAYDAKQAESIFSFAPATGTSTSTTYGLDLYDSASNLAVGSDGSLYVIHQSNIGTTGTQAFVARIDPAGAGRVLWSSVDLLALGPPPAVPSDGADTGDIALGRDDLVVVVNDVLVSSTDGSPALSDVSVASAFDPATGSVVWTVPVPGQLLGGPVVRADGTIVAVVQADGSPSGTLVSFDPASGAPTMHALSRQVFGVMAVTYDGTVIAATDDGNGIDGAMAVASDGTVLWTKPGILDATVASDGTLVARSGTAQGGATSIVALDPATGATTWELSPPVAGPTIWYVALTSDGGIVAEQADGTLFGASD